MYSTLTIILFKMQKSDGLAFGYLNFSNKEESNSHLRTLLKILKDFIMTNE